MKNKNEWHNNLERKHGVEDVTQNSSIKEKIKRTNLERYGVECNLQLISGSEHSKNIWKNQRDSINKKIKETSLKNWGTESPNQSEEVKRRQKEGLIKKFGSVEKAYRVKSYKSSNTKLERYGDKNYHNKEQMSKTLLERHLRFEKENNCTRFSKLIKEYGQGWLVLNIPVIYSGRFRYISNEFLSKIKEYSEENHNLRSESKKENELYEFIKSNTKDRVYRHKKDLIQDDKQKYELDIYIPKKRLAFEFNGTYWHSDLLKEKYYHQNKTKLCYENNIQLVHIYEQDWNDNMDEIKSRIKELLNGNDCSRYNWIPVKDYNKYTLSEPLLLKTKLGKRTFKIYTEGVFMKK